MGVGNLEAYECYPLPQPKEDYYDSQCFHLNFSVLEIIQGTEPLLLPGELAKVGYFQKGSV